MTRTDARYFVPLKTARVGEDGMLRLCYWQGNDKLKGEGKPVTPSEHGNPSEEPQAVVFFEEHFDFQTGFILEGTLTNLPLEPFSSSFGSLSFYIEHRGLARRFASIRVE